MGLLNVIRIGSQMVFEGGLVGRHRYGEDGHLPLRRVVEVLRRSGPPRRRLEQRLTLFLAPSLSAQVDRRVDPTPPASPPF